LRRRLRRGLPRKGAMEEIKRILEALLFACPEPLTAERVVAIVPGIDSEQVLEAARELREEYGHDSRSFQLVEVGGGWQLTTKPEYSVWVDKLFESGSRAHLSRAALETLAVVAYKQPVLRSGIESVRGVNVDSVLKTLMERNLVRIVGRGEGPGRPLLFGTTKDFLMQFGINKLSDLPKMEEIEELVGEKQQPSEEPASQDHAGQSETE
jgi:segregation and condensation protein B